MQHQILQKSWSYKFSLSSNIENLDPSNAENATYFCFE